MRDATRVISAVFAEVGQGEPFLAGPTFASSYRHAGDPTGAPFTYGRTSNPTWTAYESALARLEGGDCLVFGSGLAAVSAVLCSTLRQGDRLVMPADGYFGARALTEGFLTNMGVQVDLVATADIGTADLDGVRLVLIETPCNPWLDVCDVRQIVASAHAGGALVAVDNTTATVLGQQPLALGADFSIGSDTKALTGHSDILIGHVAVSDPVLRDALVDWRTHSGAIAGPMETWLAHRSLATLALRLQRQCTNAQRLAEALSRHPSVVGCRYPGLPDDPSHRLAASQMASYGPVLNFTLDSQQSAERWLERCRLVVPATSFGSVHTTAERRGRWAGDQVPDGFIRLSAGIEDPDDLVEDLTAALG